MRKLKLLAPIVIMTLLLSVTGSAYATTLAPNPALEFQGQGLSIAVGGGGLQKSDTDTIDVDIGGPVVSATLYWTARDNPCAPDGVNCAVPAPPGGADDELLLDGIPVIAERVTGTELQEAGGGLFINNIGFAADVTAQVAAKGTGPQTFTLADGDAADLNSLDGAGLLIIYVDEADPNFYRIIVYEGLDFAYRNADGPAAARVTEPITFSYDATLGDRDAEVAVFVGDAELNRPDEVRIDGESFFNAMDADDGKQFDADVFGITVPGGDTSTTAQLFSEKNALNNDLPDSLLWITGVLRLPIDAANGRMTGGANVKVGDTHIKGSTGGLTIHCDITLSNNIQVTWPGGNKWHIDKEQLNNVVCLDDPAIDPVPPAAPFDTFIAEAEGKLNGSGVSIMRFRFVDDGEPGTSDFVDIKIWSPGDNPDADTPFFEISGNLDGGNLQAHFDQPHK